MTRILVLSDLHLSPTHGFFWDNWALARDTANTIAPAAVIVTGDLCINGPDSDRTVDGLRHVWAPSTAFMTNHPLGGDPRPGMLAIDFAGPEPVVELLRPPGMAELDLATIKGHGRYKFLRDMPACPPRAA